MSEQDFGPPDAFAGHDPCCGVGHEMGVLLPLIAIALFVLGVLVAVIAARASREARLGFIYDAIFKDANRAANGPVDEALERMMKLRGTIRTLLGPMIADGVISSAVKEITEAVSKPPKAEPAKVKPTYAASFEITDAATAALKAEDKSAKSLNEKAHETAKKFLAYWKDDQQRMKELRGLHNNLSS